MNVTSADLKEKIKHATALVDLRQSPKSFDSTVVMRPDTFDSTILARPEMFDSTILMRREDSISLSAESEEPDIEPAFPKI